MEIQIEEGMICLLFPEHQQLLGLGLNPRKQAIAVVLQEPELECGQ